MWKDWMQEPLEGMIHAVFNATQSMYRLLTVRGLVPISIVYVLVVFMHVVAEDNGQYSVNEVIK